MHEFCCAATDKMICGLSSTYISDYPQVVLSTIHMQRSPHADVSKNCAILITLGLFAACGEATSEELTPEPTDLRSVAFAPDPFFPEGDDEDPESWIGEPSELIAEVSLEGGGKIRFLDGSPSKEFPSISTVVVEPNAPKSVLDVVRYQSASPLELFLTVAPDAPIPPKLELDHLAHFDERGLSPEPRRLDTNVVPYGHTVEDDDWGPDCDDADNWAEGFDDWSSVATGRMHVPYLNPLYPPSYDVYGYFSTYDYIWAGVCKHEYGIAPHAIEMQYWDGSNYVRDTTTYDWVTIKNRYLYQSFVINPPARRIKVIYKGATDQYLLSGAWKEWTWL